MNHEYYLYLPSVSSFNTIIICIIVENFNLCYSWVLVRRVLESHINQAGNPYHTAEADVE